MKITVNLGARSYDILFGSAAGGAERDALNAKIAKRNYLVVTDANVAKVTGIMAGAAHHVVLEPGEEHKHLDTVERICEAALEAGLDRTGVIVGLGGGVVGDLAGFAASIYMRGIGVIHVPTSLLAMVDSSIGGKTGADLRSGKNLVGAFHQPELVLIDPAFLTTLPKQELTNGMAEVIKYAMLFDENMFKDLHFQRDALRAAGKGAFLPIIRRCCAIKAEIVSADETEHGQRALLNYGHTFGHAVELLSGFRITHGAGVAIGMCAAGNVAIELGLWSKEEDARQKMLIEEFELPTAIPAEFSAKEMIAAMRRDKKATGGELNLVLPTAVGAGKLLKNVPEETVLHAIEATR